MAQFVPARTGVVLRYNSWLGNNVFNLGIATICWLSAVPLFALPAVSFQATFNFTPIVRGQVHTHRISLPADSCSRVEVDQRDVDLVLTLTRPEGDRIEGISASPWGRESLFICAKSPGDFQITVAVHPLDAARGKYRLRLGEVHPRDASDPTRLEAQDVLLAGLQKFARAETVAAIPLLEAAASRWQKLSELRLHIQALIRLSAACHLTGRYQRARDTLERALRAERQSRDPYLHAEILRELANVVGVFKEKRTALDLHVRALTTFRRLGDRRGEAASVESIGTTYELWKGVIVAMPYYRRALRLWEALGSARGLCSVRDRLGGIYLHEGRTALALQGYVRNLDLMRQVKDRRGETAALTGVGVALIMSGRVQDGIDRLKEALEQRQQMGDRSAAAAVHQQLAGAYRQMGQYREAMAHLQSVLHMSEQVRTEITTPNWSLGYASERNVAPLQISVLRDWHRATPKDGHDAQAFLIADWMFGRHLAPLPVPGPLGLGQVRDAILDQDTALLRFWFDEQDGVAWILTKEGLRSHDLPGRAYMEAVSGKLLDLLTARNRVLHGETSANRGQRIRRADLQFEKLARTLSQVLFGAGSVPLPRRLLISADGILQFVPFSVLPDPGDPESRPLIMDHEIVNLPSALTLIEIRKRMADQPAPDRLLAVVADPVFGPEDPRLLRAHAAGLGKAADSAAIAQATRSVGIRGNLARLPYSRREALGVIELAAGNEVTALFGFSATRQAVLSDLFRRHRIVHLATHGFDNRNAPDLSGLVFSRIDGKGKPSSGFVRLRDIYQLKVTADLVVLSACRTARGQALVNQGVVGLTSGFMYAGAPRVISTLWNVEDEATAALMKHFYAGLLSHETQSAAAALRDAQIRIASQPRWCAPYFWAGVNYYGDWQWKTR